MAALEDPLKKTFPFLTGKFIRSQIFYIGVSDTERWVTSLKRCRFWIYSTVLSRIQIR